MTVPSPSTCGGGAGGGLSVEVLSATLLAVGFDAWRARPLASVEGKGGTSLEFVGVASAAFTLVFVEVEFKARDGVLLVSAESGEGPCALVLAQERMRSRVESELGEVFFIDVAQRGRMVSDGEK